jgi:hypothetical protein
MSNRWRIVNPALVPAQVVAESGDEQAILRQCATRDPSDGLKLVKSEDDGKTWVEVEARAPDAVSEWKPPPDEPLKGIKADHSRSEVERLIKGAPPIAEKTTGGELERGSSGANVELERGELGARSGAAEHAETRTKHRK